jgi:hypothetical protein
MYNYHKRVCSIAGVYTRSPRMLGQLAAAAGQAVGTAKCPSEISGVLAQRD